MTIDPVLRPHAWKLVKCIEQCVEHLEHCMKHNVACLRSSLHDVRYWVETLMLAALHSASVHGVVG